MVIKEEIIEVLKNTNDPELDIDIHTLGLIYGVDFDEQKQQAKITMTFTTPFCPYGPAMLSDIRKKISALGIDEPKIDVVFDPPWEPTEEVREMLGV